MPLSMNIPRIHRETRDNGKRGQRTRPSRKAKMGRSRFDPKAKADAKKYGWSKHPRRVKRMAKKKD